jgi:hypothetical protein
VALVTCCADLDAAVCGERRDCSEDALFVNTIFGSIATSVQVVAKKRGFSVVANF